MSSGERQKVGVGDLSGVGQVGRTDVPLIRQGQIIRPELVTRQQPKR